MEKTIFLDTNVYLHYQPFDQIDWKGILGAETVSIVVPPITVRELNKLKDLHVGQRISKRAGSTLQKLNSLFVEDMCVECRDGICIKLEDRDPIIDPTKHRLNPEVQDDILIANVLAQIEEMPDADVLLVTSDAGLSLLAKARRQGIKTYRLPDKYKIEDTPDPNEQRVRELEKELRELTAQMPRLRLFFEHGLDFTTYELQPSVAEDDAVQTRLDEMRQRFPMIVRERPKREQLAGAERSLSVLAAFAGTGVQPEEIERYNKDVDRFHQQYANYLAAESKYRDLRQRTFPLMLELANEGTAPAEDIDIRMHFPDGFNLLSEDGYPEPPTEPTPPRSPRTPSEMLMESLKLPMMEPNWSGRLLGTDLPLRNVSSPVITRTSSYDVEVHVDRVKHHTAEPLDTLFVVFRSLDIARSFEFSYEILAGNIPNKIEGVLRVAIPRPDPS